MKYQTVWEVKDSVKQLNYNVKNGYLTILHPILFAQAYNQQRKEFYKKHSFTELSIAFGGFLGIIVGAIMFLIYLFNNSLISYIILNSGLAAYFAFFISFIASGYFIGKFIGYVIGLIKEGRK